MGITIFNWEVYIKQVLQEHLHNKQVYLNITIKYQTRLQDLSMHFKQLSDRHANTLRKSILTFFTGSQEDHSHNIACFQSTAKVHKTPIKLWQIVAKVGTAIESLSKWPGIMLQKLMKQLPWCIKNYPPNARLVTFDAISMYSIIDLDHARTIMKHWLESSVPEDITDALPHDTILEALDLAMRHNICNSEIPTFYNWLVLQ